MRSNRLILLTAVFWAVLGGMNGSLLAEFEEVSKNTGPGFLSYRLSLDEVSRLAVRNSLDIQIAKYDAKIARTGEGVAESIYDTILEAEVEYRNNQKAITTTLLGNKSLDNDYNIGVSKKLPTGTTIGVDMTNNRKWTNSPFATLNPSHDSSLGITVEQELGQNLLGIQDRGDIKITKLDIENSDYTSLDRIEQIIAEAQKAYWDLVLATEKYRIEQGMVRQAKELYDLHQEKIKDGLIESPELYASEANYKDQRNNLKLAENEMAIKINTLKLILNIKDDVVTLMPIQQFFLEEEKKEMAMSLKTAFENRRDYKRKLNDIKSKDIKLSMEKNNLWPKIDLTASFTQNGLGDHFKQAVENITDESNPEIYAGIVFSFPIENTKARAKLSAAEMEKAKTLISLKLIERKITINTADQVRTCNIFKEAARNNQEIADLQKKKLQEEQKSFQWGRSDTDTIIRYQNDYLAAQLQAAQAMFRYHAALVDLREIEGSLLNQYWDAANFSF